MPGTQAVLNVQFDPGPTATIAESTSSNTSPIQIAPLPQTTTARTATLAVEAGLNPGPTRTVTISSEAGTVTFPDQGLLTVELKPNTIHHFQVQVHITTPDRCFDYTLTTQNDVKGQPLVIQQISP